MIKEFEKRLLSSFILIPIAIFFIIKGSVLFVFFLSVLFLITSHEWIKMNKKNDLLKYLGISFLLFSFYATFEIREENNLKYFLFIITICIFTDIGGYLFGKIFNGPKLTKISPNKTYAGMLGGFVLSLIVASLFLSNLNIFSLSNADHHLEKNIMIVVLCISFISQVGDLIISFFKRKSKVKNTGKIIPGHGGILDRIDGMLFAYPFIYISTKIL